MVVDANGTEVGTVDLGTGLVPWKVGNALLLLTVTPAGLYEGDIFFYHTSTDCSGPRYLSNNGGLFAYYAAYSNGIIFYTTLSDASQPLLPDELNSYETVHAGSDPLLTGDCTQISPAAMSMGLVTTVVDPTLNALVPPFRLR